jgi:hypothetical protein
MDGGEVGWELTDSLLETQNELEMLDLSFNLTIPGTSESGTHPWKY